MEKQEQTTQSKDLDSIIKEGLQQFDIPADEPADSDQVASPASDDKAGDNETTVPDDETKPFRFKGHAEAEEGYRNAERKITQLSEEVKALNTRLTSQEVEQKRKEKEEAVSAEFEAQALDMRIKLLDEIDALDPDDAEYRKKVAHAQARTDLAIAHAARKMGVTIPTQEAPAAPQPAAAETQPNPETNPEENATDARAYVRDKITGAEHGLNADDPYFWMIAQSAPVQDDKGQPLTLDQQIGWAVTQTKNYHAKILGQSHAAGKQAENAARAEMPMGRSSSGSPPGAQAGKNDSPVSLNDAVDKAMNFRRL